MSVLNELLETNRKVNITPYYGYDYETIDCEHDIVMACEQYNEIESDFNAIDRLEEIGVGLERLLTISEDSLQEGGLYSSEAGILHYAHSALIEPLNIPTPILATESFGATGERLSSTRVSIEEEKGTLKKIWEAIKRAFIALREKLVKWYNSIFNVADKLKEKYTAMAKTIDGLGSKSIKGDKEIEFSSGALLSKGQTELALKTNLANLESETNSFLKDSGVRSVVSAMLSELEKMDFKKDTPDDLWKKGFEPHLKKMLATSKTKKSTTDIPSIMNMDDMVTEKHDELPGNKALFSYQSKISIFDFNKLVKIGWKVGPFKEGNDIKEKVKYKVMSMADLKTVVEQGSRLVDIIIEFKKGSDETKKIKERISKLGDKISTDVKDNEAVSGKKALNLLRQFERFLDNPTNQLTNLSIKTLSSLLNLMNAMVKSYS